MPCLKELDVDTNKPVLVTGGTGYVAGVLISQLLDLGVAVRATVRDPSKKDRIQYLLDAADKSKGSITFFAADLLEPGSFDKAASGCSVIFHTASPFTFNVVDPDKDLIEPAVRGTENVLGSASKNSTVKRVVLTSSVAAIYCDAIDVEETPERKFTEEIWNRTATRTTSPYSLSKTLAEQKAWVIAGSQTQWKLTVINPSFVMGPGLKYHASSESFKFMIQLASGQMAVGAPPLPLGIVDVRDVAAAHIAAAYLPQASGRHICNGHDSSVLGLGLAVSEKYAPPTYPVPIRALPVPYFVLWLVMPWLAPMSRKYISKNFGRTMTLDNTKSKEALGIDYIPLTKTAQDMFQQLLDEKAIEAKE